MTIYKSLIFIPSPVTKQTGGGFKKDPIPSKLIGIIEDLNSSFCNQNTALKICQII